MPSLELGETGAQLRRALEEQLEEAQSGLSRIDGDLDLELLPIFGRMRALASLYQTFYARLLESSGLTQPEFHVVETVRATGPRSPTDLARWVRQTTAGMTKTIDRLERAELVERRAHASDRRSVEVVLTAKGEEVTDRLLRAEITAHQEILADIGPDGRERLRDLLDQAIERLVDGTPRPSPDAD